MLEQRFDDAVEFLFIDGRSEDRSLQILAELAERDPRVRVLDNPARGTTAALNVGLQHARGEIICRMDAHTYFPPVYLAVGVRRLNLGDDVANVSGPALATGAGGWSDAVALALNGSFGTGGAAFRHAQPEESEVDTGFAGVWRKQTLLAAGGWDEEWVADEDFELASRLRASGHRLVCVPEMAASYIPRDTLSGLARQYWRYGYYRPMTAQRHPHSMRRSHAAPPALALAAAAALAGPRATRLAGRAGIGAWVLATLAVAARAATGGACKRDAIRLPIVLGVMHFTYGFAFLAGCARLGVPLRAIKGLLRPRSD
jgi:glycosyltransferase involved in cell wall biosynthesis